MSVFMVVFIGNALTMYYSMYELIKMCIHFPVDSYVWSYDEQMLWTFLCIYFGGHMDLFFMNRYLELYLLNVPTS